ncbi:hypothetical protein KIW84_072631 [Lathyrus oleraceus]|uniref:C2H2-type domain-containing protein n=1 Tax=Pisum sativum TaxID=3888 RepID=A0A9D4VP17_PEA|nr:hypothetical protein KIW84_072631 [Pisum sativum]
MMSGEVGWLVLVSDDREFAEMLRKVREVNLKTVVVGDYWDRDLGKNVDLWLPWNVVENGKLEGMGLMGKTEGLDDELEGDQDLDYGEYVTEEELYERWTMRVDLRGRSQDQSLSQSPNSIECQNIVGVDSEKRKTSMVMTLVIILWDLDNKPPRGPPYDAALSLKTLAERFGDVVSISAYTKRHSFFNLPQWNTNQNPNPNSIPCRVCGHECKSIFDLKIHFKRVHLYQRKKLREKLKSIKLSRSKVWFVRRIHTYNEAL